MKFYQKLFFFYGVAILKKNTHKPQIDNKILSMGTSVSNYYCEFCKDNK